MPSRKRSTKMKRKKPAQKQQNLPQLQFVGENEGQSDVGTASYSRHSEDDGVTNAPDRKKTLALKDRPMLLRANSSTLKLNSKERDSPLLNHIPLYAPSDRAPRSYTQVIRGYFDNYLESLSQVGPLAPRLLSWDNPVVVGRHNKLTIDAIRPGQRMRDLNSWYETAINSDRSEPDGYEVDAKKPRLDIEDESPMTVDDEDCINDDDENGKSEDDEDDLKSYLKEEDSEFQFDPEKSQKSYARAKSDGEGRHCIDVPPDDASDEDIIDSLSVRGSTSTKETRSKQKGGQGNKSEEDTANGNENNQSFVKKIMRFARKENNTSLISAWIDKAMPWKNRVSKQDDKLNQSKTETANCIQCNQAFNKNAIDDHAAESGQKDAAEAKEIDGAKPWCYRCQRVIGGVQVDCGRHPSANGNNNEQKQ